VAEQQQAGRAPRSGRAGWVPGEAGGPGGCGNVGPRHCSFVQDDLISPKCRQCSIGASGAPPLPMFRPERLRFAYPGW
jgi:hypothetical protein